MDSLSSRVLDNRVTLLAVLFGGPVELYGEGGEVMAMQRTPAILFVLIEERGSEASTVNQVLNALRFLYVELYKRPLVLGLIPHPRRTHSLPVVLRPEEVKGIFACIFNLKHRVLLELIYSAGLRVGEAVRLRIEDIDAERGLIHVRRGKGGTDRYTDLAEGMVKQIKGYLSSYRPSDYLFPGESSRPHLAERRIQNVFSRAVRSAGIRKSATIHTLLHSIAPHLLEAGTELRSIQELLGHRSSKTTEVYTHVSRAAIGRIVGPCDRFTQPRNK